MPLNLRASEATKAETALRKIAGFMDEMADFNKEAVTIAREALAAIRAPRPPEPLNGAEDATGTQPGIARQETGAQVQLLPAPPSLPLSTEHGQGSGVDECCGCGAVLAGNFHENCVCLAKLGKPGCMHGTGSGVDAKPSEEPIPSWFFSFDARDWAKAFMDLVRDKPRAFIDEGLMLAWFANAIMRGHDTGRERLRAELAVPSPEPPREEPR